jgi:excinuclease UvrABC ATPase subunit
MQISDLAEWVRSVDEPSVAPLLKGLRHLLDSFTEIGLGLPLPRPPAGTLSAGEAQRTKMIRHLGSSLTDVTYVFDEPTIGLHPHDIQRMNDLLLRLRDKGNTVLVVEHKPETIAIADHVVDLGPGAARPAARLLRGHRRGAARERHRHRPPPRRPGDAQGRGARVDRRAGGPRRSTNNLRDVDVDIPLGVLCVLTGVAGSGKSSLIQRLGRRPRRRGGDRPGRDPRVAPQQPRDVHRPAGADPQGVRQGERRQAGAVQLQLRGRLPDLQRRGRHLHRARRDGDRRVAVRGVRGQRFQASVLEYTLGGRNIAEVLAMSVDEAEAFFGDGRRETPAAHKVLLRLADVGLGYLTLGPAAHHAVRAESGSGSSWPPRWRRRATSTSSTSRPPGCTWPTSRTCWACSTGSSTRAGR